MEKGRIEESLASQLAIGSSAGIVFILRVLSTFCSFLTIVLVGRSLGPVGLGEIAIARTLLLTTAGILGPALDTACVRFASHDPQQADYYCQTIFWLKLFITLLFLSVGMLFAVPLRNLLFREGIYGTTSPGFVIAALGGAGIFMLFEYIRTYYQALQRFFLYGLLDFVHALLRLMAIGIMIIYGVRSSLYLFITYAGLPLVLTLPFLFLVPSFFPFRMISLFVYLKKMCTFIRWVALACVFTSIANGLDMLLLSQFQIDEIARGNYSAARTLAQVGDLAVLSFFSVLLPKAGSVQQKQEVNRFLTRNLLWTGGLCLMMFLILLLMHPLLRFLLIVSFGKNFESAWLVLFVWLIGLLTALVGVPASAVMYASGHSRTIAFLEGIKILFTFVWAMVLVPQYGIVGMAWTVAFAKGSIATLTILCAFFTTQKHRENLQITSNYSDA